MVWTFLWEAQDYFWMFIEDATSLFVSLLVLKKQNLIVAMKKELHMIEKNNTWQLVDKPHDRNIHKSFVNKLFICFSNVIHLILIQWFKEFCKIEIREAFSNSSYNLNEKLHST